MNILNVEQFKSAFKINLIMLVIEVEFVNSAW